MKTIALITVLVALASCDNGPPFDYEKDKRDGWERTIEHCGEGYIRLNYYGKLVCVPYKDEPTDDHP